MNVNVFMQLSAHIIRIDEKQQNIVTIFTCTESIFIKYRYRYIQMEVANLKNNDQNKQTHFIDDRDDFVIHGTQHTHISNWLVAVECRSNRH